MKTIFFVFALSILSLQINASEPCKSEEQAMNECCETRKATQLTRTSRLETNVGHNCTLSVYSTKADTSFRRFGFAGDGQLSVFIQPGGNSQKQNSSQSYLIYPFGELPISKVESDGTLTVKTGSGQKIVFDPRTATPTSIEGCQIEVRPNITLQDSGFKIKSCEKHLVIETKVEVGGEYIAYPDKSLTIKDPKGHSCEVKNSDLYNYEKSGKSVHDRAGRFFTFAMKFKKNEDMAKSLKKLCPRLDVSMLKDKSPSPVNNSAEEKRVLDILEGKNSVK